MSTAHPRHTPRDDEPLLGRPGGFKQSENDSWVFNLVRGTGLLAQFGGVLLLATIWSAVFSHKLIPFSAHPLFNSAGVVLGVEAMLLLQPTHTPEQKRVGAHIHGALNMTAALCYIAAISAVEWNKVHHHIPHFESPHAVLGLITYILIGIQAFIGFTQFYTPSIYGGEDNANAKKLYKYHRVGGYTILLFQIITAALATKTYYGEHILHIKTWLVLSAGVLVLLGVFPRINKQKLAFFSS